jgi:hypothetical protein
MIYLKASTDILRITTGSAATVDAVAFYVQAALSGGSPADWNYAKQAFSSATSVDLLAGPGSTNFYTIKQISIHNKDASLSCDVTVQLRITGPVDYQLRKETLAPGETLIYMEFVGFYKLAASTTKSGLKSVSTADQSIGASATAYITGSAITLPPTAQLVAGIVLRWTMLVGKSAAATAAETGAIRFGTGGSTSDTARNSFALDTETAAADECIDTVIATIRGPIGASCIVEATWIRDNHGAAGTVGFSNTVRKAQVVRTQSAAFDITPAGTIAGLSLATGASHALTVRQCVAEMLLLNAG